MMASSLPLVPTELRCPPSTSGDGHGGTRPNGGGRRNEDSLNWCAWAHQGHRLWVGMPDSFWVFTYKVERCPFPGNHVWMSCPYAHRGERARRRDPRSFRYAAAPCPEYEESKRQLRLAGSSATPTCARGLHCGYAHGIFETWLHPTRFRTVMCQRGAECTRRICFFAHCLAQRRREDEEVPLVVFPVTQPPPVFVPRAPRLAASASSSSRSRSQSVSIVSRPVDRVTQAMQQGHSVHLLTRHSDVAGASSSSSSLAAVSTTAAAPTALVPLSAPLLQASPSPVDDEDIDFVAIVTNCCLASEADSKAEGSGYSHFDLFMDILRR
ncbi:zinc finger CCCH domain-containing protein 2-like [Miscanthus floridulus]|uniref:zinc finger CCCH domain-containing protein 2-like n=1 Tax=Miscanthus floridulus TaxID=154761 RepID=UPI003459ABEC